MENPLEISEQALNAIDRLGMAGYIGIVSFSVVIIIVLVLVVYVIKNIIKNQFELSAKLDKISETLMVSYEKLGNRTENQIGKLTDNIDKLVSSIPSMTSQIIQSNMENTAHIEQVNSEISHIRELQKKNDDTICNHLETIYDRLTGLSRDINRKAN